MNFGQVFWKNSQYNILMQFIYLFAGVMNSKSTRRRRDFVKDLIPQVRSLSGRKPAASSFFLTSALNGFHYIPEVRTRYEIEEASLQEPTTGTTLLRELVPKCFFGRVKGAHCA